MPKRRLTIECAFDTLPNEWLRARRQKAGVRRSRWTALRCRWPRWLVLVGWVAGCAAISVNSTPEAKAKYVAERAQARWELLIKGDVDGAYQYLSAGSKATMSLDAYKARIERGVGMWRKVSVDKVDCEAEVCNAQLEVTYDAKQMKGIQTPVKEAWIIENGSAWYVYH